MDVLAKPGMRSFDCNKNRDICSRYKNPDSIQLLEARLPWNSQLEMSGALEWEESNSILWLGGYGIRSRAGPIVLSAVVSSPSQHRSSAEQEGLLLPNLFLCRVSGELGIKQDGLL
jgi:hypothetical protein